MFEQGVIRPPSEASSLLVRVTRNCPWNRCHFCPAYKGTSFSKRSVSEIKKDIDEMAQVYDSNIHQIDTAFLQDADSLIIPTQELLDILHYLKERFPRINRVTTYARAKSMKKKSVKSLKALKEAGLNRIHTGLESGSLNVLKLVRKGESPEDMIKAGEKVMESGISLSEYIIPGLGGKEFSKEHALETAKVLNRIRPDFIRLRTFTLPPDSPMSRMVDDGKFHPLNDIEILNEIRLLLQNLDEMPAHFCSADFGINLLIAVDGYLERDKKNMLEELDKFLSYPIAAQKAFILLHRTGYWSHSPESVIKDKRLMNELIEKIEELEKENEDGFYKHIRKLMAHSLPPPQTDNWV